MTKFFIIIPTHSKAFGYIKHVFGPYKTEKSVLRVDDVIGPGEIIELNANTLNEAIEMLNRARGEEHC